MLELIHNSVDYLKKATELEPEIGIILGTGLGGLVDEIKTEKLNVCKKNICIKYLYRPNKELTDFCHMPTVYDW